MKIVVDAFAWVEIFSGSQGGKLVKIAMEEADALITPDTVLAEIARKYLREGIEEEVVRQRLSQILEASEPAFIDDTIAVEAGRAYLELEERSRKLKLSKPSLFDGLILAVARINDARVLSGDQHFQGLPETIWIS